MLAWLVTLVSPTLAKNNMNLGTVTTLTFEPSVGEAFTLEGTGSIRLIESKELPHPPFEGGRRQPFKLIFRGEAPMLHQGTYRLENETLGLLEIFLVPIAGDGTTFTYEAIFN